MIYDPSKTTTLSLLQKFWEDHDPTQGNQQGNDVGTQYISAIYYDSEEQHKLALSTATVCCSIVSEHENNNRN